MNKTGILKTTVKSLIALLLFSLVLEINEKNFFNYLIFVGFWLLMTFIYELIKYSMHFEINNDTIEIKGILKHNVISFRTVKDVFITTGILQTRFKLSSVYLVQESRTVPLRDLTNGQEVLNAIESRIGKKPTDLSIPDPK